MIVLVTIQRDSRYLHGLRTIKLPGNIYDHKIPAFQLGRKTYGAPFAYTSLTSSSSTINIAQPAAANATHFFKVSWREDRFPKKEHEIIEEARERARKLPKKHWTSIEDHLPVIQDAELLTDTSTAIIRTILGLERKYSRSLYWMISKKLERIERIVPEFQKFQKAYWDIVRCNLLLVFSLCRSLIYMFFFQVTAYFGSSGSPIVTSALAILCMIQMASEAFLTTLI